LNIGHLLSSRTKNAYKSEYYKRQQHLMNKVNRELRQDQLKQRQEDERISRLKEQYNNRSIDPDDDFFHPAAMTSAAVALFVAPVKPVLFGDEFGPALVVPTLSPPASVVGGTSTTISTTTTNLVVGGRISYHHPTIAGPTVVSPGTRQPEQQQEQQQGRVTKTFSLICKTAPFQQTKSIVGTPGRRQQPSFNIHANATDFPALGTLQIAPPGQAGTTTTTTTTRTSHMQPLLKDSKKPKKTFPPSNGKIISVTNSNK
jgi:hypothetical protein